MLERDPAWTAAQLGLAEFLELARAVRELLDGARPLDARDLALPDPAPDPGIDAADLAARTAIATGALRDARAQLRRRSAAGPLRPRSRGPPSSASPRRRAAALAELDRRARPSRRPRPTARASPPCSATASGCCRA